MDDATKTPRDHLLPLGKLEREQLFSLKGGNKYQIPILQCQTIYYTSWLWNEQNIFHACEDEGLLLMRTVLWEKLFFMCWTLATKYLADDGEQ